MPSEAESPIDPLVSAGEASGSEEFWIAAIDQNEQAVFGTIDQLVALLPRG